MFMPPYFSAVANILTGKELLGPTAKSPEVKLKK